MNDIIVATITSIGTFLGVLITVIVNYKKTRNDIKSHTETTLYRIEQLEKKQDKHNTLIERMYKVEGRLDKVDEQIKVVNHRITDINKE